MSRLYTIRDLSRDKPFEIEMGWLCAATGHKYAAVPAALLYVIKLRLIAMVTPRRQEADALAKAFAVGGAAPGDSGEAAAMDTAVEMATE